MDFITLITVEEREIAQQVMEHIRYNGINAYVAENIEQDIAKWDVMVDGSKVLEANDLLSRFLEENDLNQLVDDQTFETESNEPDYSYSYNESAYEASQKSHSGNAKVVAFIIAAILFGVRFYMKYEKQNRENHQMEYLSNFNHYGLYGDDNTSDVSETIPTEDATDNSEEMTVALPEVTATEVVDNSRMTLQSWERSIQRENNGCPKDIGKGLVFTKAKMVGSKISYDYIVKEQFVQFYDTSDCDQAQVSQIKKDLMKDVYNELKGNALIFGDDYLDQMASLGISINYRYFKKGEKNPFQTITITARELRNFQKGSRA